MEELKNEEAGINDAGSQESTQTVEENVSDVKHVSDSKSKAKKSSSKKAAKGGASEHEEKIPGPRVRLACLRLFFRNGGVEKAAALEAIVRCVDEGLQFGNMRDDDKHAINGYLNGTFRVGSASNQYNLSKYRIGRGLDLLRVVRELFNPTQYFIADSIIHSIAFDEALINAFLEAKKN